MAFSTKMKRIMRFALFIAKTIVLFMAGSLEIDLSMDVESEASWMEVHTDWGHALSGLGCGVLCNFLRTLW